MKNLKNKYLLCHWIHNEGYETRWLRRITRQTKTQLICDVQRTLLLSDKYKKMYDNRSDYFIGIVKRWAKRFYMKDGKIIAQNTHLSNPDGKSIITFIDDNKDDLLCSLSYNELFERDIREFLPEDSSTRETITQYVERKGKFYAEQGVPFDGEKLYTIVTEPMDENDDIWGETTKHLKKLFNRLVYMVNELYVKICTTHDEKSLFRQTATHYHINHHGDDKLILTRIENKFNRTISFWLFEDRVVFKDEDGIGTW